jgi:hypothetical protein
MNRQSQQYIFFRNIVSFATCFNQLGHLQVIKQYVEYGKEYCRYKVL